MTDKLRQEAKEAAIDHGMWLAPDDDETNAESFVAGYFRGWSDKGVEIEKADLAAATAREKEIEELKTKTALLEVERNAMLVVLTDYKRADREAYAEIASLRAKLEAVPVEEITEARNFLRTIGRTMKAYAVTDTIDRWLATVTK